MMEEVERKKRRRKKKTRPRPRPPPALSPTLPTPPPPLSPLPSSSSLSLLPKKRQKKGAAPGIEPGASPSFFLFYQIEIFYRRSAAGKKEKC